MTPPVLRPPVPRLPTLHLPNGWEISDARERLDMAFVTAQLATAYWAQNRQPGETERAWSHCLPFGVYAPDGSMAGFCRVLTDHAFRAHLADLMIVPAHRSRGLGKALVKAVLDHPALRTVGTWTLATADAHGLYERHGFRRDVPGGKHMTMVRDAVP